jgi:sugar/nucleoside kinase (ribokinase family)
VDSFVERVVDTVGAGDALLAYATLAMLATKSDTVATILGSMAAACECERDGNVPITPGDVHKKIDDVERQANYR